MTATGAAGITRTAHLLTTVMNDAKTPQAVAEDLAEVLPKRIKIYDVELVQTISSGCFARAIVGRGGGRRVELSGTGPTLQKAIDRLMDAEWTVFE